MGKLQTLFKKDVKGNIRYWRAIIDEQDPSRYATLSGRVGGTETQAGWTQAKPKNKGRSNATTASEQAMLEALAKQQKKLDMGWTTDPSGGDGPSFTEPMLAIKYTEAALKKFPPPYFVQPKLDGIRCIARADGLWSRKGKPIVSCEHIWKELQPLFEIHPDLVLDGELYNHKYYNDFEGICSAVKKQKVTAADIAKIQQIVQYHVYDVASLSCNFGKRITLVHHWFDHGKFVVPVKTGINVMGPEEIDIWYKYMLDKNYEGLMIRTNSPYEFCPNSKRSKFLMKRKEFISEEFEIVAIEEGLGTWAGMAKRVVCCLPNGEEFGAGVKGSMAHAKKILKEKEKYIGGQATVRFQSYTKDGVPRFPVVYEFHPAKTGREY